jgi:hypothetical protein
MAASKLHYLQVDNREVTLKETRKGFRVVYPIRNKDNSINYRNLFAGGSWWNLLIIALIVGLILGCVWEYSHNINLLKECIANPYSSDFCISLKSQLSSIS